MKKCLLAFHPFILYLAVLSAYRSAMLYEGEFYFSGTSVIKLLPPFQIYFPQFFYESRFLIFVVYILYYTRIISWFYFDGISILLISLVFAAVAGGIRL